MTRNLLTTTTAKGSYLSLFAVVLLTCGNGLQGIAQRAFPQNKQGIADIVALANALGAIAGISGTGLTLKGRYDATDDVHTPYGLPGRDPDH